MLLRTEEGKTRHADAVPYVEAVPSKREAMRAFTEIVAALPFDQADALGGQIEIVRAFLWTR